MSQKRVLQTGQQAWEGGWGAWWVLTVLQRLRGPTLVSRRRGWVREIGEGEACVTRASVVGEVQNYRAVLVAT